MRSLVLVAAGALSILTLLWAGDPFGWLFNAGLIGVGSTAAGSSLLVLRLWRSGRRWLRAAGRVLAGLTTAAAALLALVVADHRLVVLRRADAVAWRADLADLRREARRAPAGLRLRAESTLLPALALLERDLAGLDDDQRQARLVGAVAGLRDGHSADFPFFSATDFSLVPLRLCFFADGLFVTDAPAHHRALIGMRVAKIAGLETEAAFHAMRPYISADNESAARVRAPVYFLSPRLWRAIGQPTSAEWLDLELIDPAGRHQRAQVAPASRLRYLWWYLQPGAWVWPPAPPRGDPPSQEWRRDPWWLTAMPERHAVYVAFRGVRDTRRETLTAFGGRLIETARASRSERIVIDVRENSGGDNTRFSGLIAALKASEFNERGRLFLLTGGGTFSAATNFVTVMERQTRAIRVGEPTGSGPNHFGDPRLLKLPRTGVVLFLSSRWHQFGAPDDPRLSHEPDVPVAVASADYFAGRDPVLEAALTWLPR